MTAKLTDNIYFKHLIDHFQISPSVLKKIGQCEEKLADRFRYHDEVCSINQLKVLQAFQDSRVSDTHFGWNTGYGYDDAGRAAVERVYANVFHAEAALVRPNIVNGTHAIATALFGMLKPGEELIYASGKPYDTLQTVIGKQGGGGEFRGTILDYGILYKEVPLQEDGDVDLEAILASVSDKTRVVALQRSTGYDWRPAIPLRSIRKVTEAVHDRFPGVLIFVDNCYGEFVETEEPTDYGADIMAGSLIKNPGGGLALCGGYIAGRADLIERISYRLTCPGIGAECGLTFGQNRTVLQGLFLAPQVTNAAVKGALLCGVLYDSLGYEVCPPAYAERSDIVQAIKFRNREKCVSFCQAVQASSPVDSYVTPVPWEMPGYEDEVIMASGSFIQGSSIELSADAPLREPYIAYFQGGLTFDHARFGLIRSLDTLVKRGLITL